LLVTLPTGCLCDLLYTLATATPRYSPQQLLLLLQLMPAWRTPPHAAVNAKRALVGAWFQATHRTLLLQQQQQQQQQQQMQPPAPPPAAAAMQPPFVAAALKSLAAAHLRPPPAWLQLALSVLTQHLSLTSAAAAGSSQQQQQQWMHWQQQQQFDPEELSRVVLALSKLGAQPEGQEAAVLLTATQVGNLAQGKEWEAH
jgi:hypothetical protein